MTTHLSRHFEAIRSLLDVAERAAADGRYPRSLEFLTVASAYADELSIELLALNGAAESLRDG